MRAQERVNLTALPHASSIKYPHRRILRALSTLRTLTPQAYSASLLHHCRTVDVDLVEDHLHLLPLRAGLRLRLDPHVLLIASAHRRDIERDGVALRLLPRVLEVALAVRDGLAPAGAVRTAGDLHFGRNLASHLFLTLYPST